MNIEFLLLGDYGYFVWPAFIFAYVSCFLLYLKTKNELKKQEKMFLNNFKQLHIVENKVAKRQSNYKKALSGNLV